jgi:hypothetical protein
MIEPFSNWLLPKKARISGEHNQKLSMPERSVFFSFNPLFCQQFPCPEAWG